MAELIFNDVSELNFEVQWLDGQPKLVCMNKDSKGNEDDKLADGDVASDTTDTDVREQATISVTVTAQGPPVFTACNVYDYNGQPPPWDRGQKTITLGIGDEDHEITFTVAVTTTNTTTADPIEEGWSPSLDEATGVTTWVLDPYIRLTRAAYPIKGRSAS